jgi:hypothetical protein
MEKKDTEKETQPLGEEEKTGEEVQRTPEEEEAGKYKLDFNLND